MEGHQHLENDMAAQDRGVAGPLRAGVAKSDITTSAEGAVINDPLYAKALVLDDGSTQVIIIAIDAVTGDTSVLLAGQYFDPTGHAALSPDLDDAPGYQGFLAARGFDGSWTPGAETYWDIFMVPVSDDADGYLLPVDPTLFVDVTNKPGSDQFHPSWSPDGATIACFDDKSLAVYDVATGQSWTIAPNYQTGVSAQDRPAWTSDGWGLVFQSSDIGVGDLAISVALENSPPINYTATRRLTEKATAWNPMWNPDAPGGF